MAKNRPLRNVYQRLDKFDSYLRGVVQQKGHADVLEVGCGFGLPMIELIRKFCGKINITGINKSPVFNDPKRAMIEGVKKYALWPWVPLIHQYQYQMPAYVNCDASRSLPFESDSFDFIYSIATVFFLEDRLNFLAEVNRVLRPGQMARLHFSYTLREFKSFSETRLPDKDMALIVMETDSGEFLSFPELIGRFPNLKLVKSKIGHEYLELTKRCATLDLGVQFMRTRMMKDIDRRFPDFPQSIYRVGAA